MTEIVLNKCYGGYSLSKEAYEFLGLEWDEYGFAFENDRTNPQLIECVRHLGKKASGSCANLVIESLPEYTITNHSGFEIIHY